MEEQEKMMIIMRDKGEESMSRWNNYILCTNQWQADSGLITTHSGTDRRIYRIEED